MSRPSNRSAIVDAALRVAERSGLGAISIEAVAAEAGLTKGGVVYHFPTRAELFAGIHRELAERWDAEMREILGGDPAGASPRDRLVAYIRASAETATPGEYLFVSDAETTRVNVAPWDEVSARWVDRTPQPDAEGRYDSRALRWFTAQLAADGLWSHEYANGARMPQALRAAVAEQLIAGLDA